jgi:hypothetical protein
VRGALIKAGLWGCVVTASCALAYLFGLGWGLLAWSVGTALFLFFVVDADPPKAVDTPVRQSTASGVEWLRRAG